MAAVAVAAMALTGCSADDPPGGEGRLSIATGGSGGVYQVYGGGVAEMLSPASSASATTAETTSASVDNLLLVAGGDSDVAFTLADTAIDAVSGNESFERPLAAARARERSTRTSPHVVVPDDSGIETIEDLKGKTVSIGAPNSGTEIIGLRLMEVAGLDPDKDVDPARAGRGGVGRRDARRLDRRVHVVRRRARRPRSPTSPRPTTSACSRSTATCPSSRAVRRGLHRGRDRGGRVHGRRRRIKTIGVPNLLMVSEDMAEATRARHHRGAVRGQEAARRGHAAGREARPERSGEDVEPVGLHPGAERFYREGGGSDSAGASRRAAGVHAGRRTPGDGGRARRGRRRRRRAPRFPPTGASRCATATPSTTRPRRSASARRRTAAGSCSRRSPRRARRVLDYYEAPGTRTREGGRWVLRLAHPARFASMPLAATGVGRRTLVAGGRSAPLYAGRRRGPHLRIGVEATMSQVTNDRRPARGVRGRAPRPQARGLHRRRSSPCSARGPVAVRDLLGLPAARGAGLPARVPRVALLLTFIVFGRASGTATAARRWSTGRSRSCRSSRSATRSSRRTSCSAAPRAGDARHHLRHRRDRCSCSRRPGARRLDPARDLPRLPRLRVPRRAASPTGDADRATRATGWTASSARRYMGLEGIFGVPLDVAATYIVLFAIYGAVLEYSGAARFFVEISFAAFGRSAHRPRPHHDAGGLPARHRVRAPASRRP